MLEPRPARSWFPHFGATCDKLVHARPGLDREPVGLGLGAGHDLRGLALGGLLLAPVFGQQRSGFLLQAARLVEVGPDTDGALVERARDHCVDPIVDQHADENHEATATQNSASPNIWSSALEHVDDGGLDLAACRCRSGQALDDAAAASTAMPWTLVMADDRRAAIVFSASPIWALSLASSALRALSAALASRSRVSFGEGLGAAAGVGHDFS